MQENIPFNTPSLVGDELDFVAQAISNRQISAGGQFTQLATAYLSNFFDGAEVLLTTSCTDALEMSAMLLNLGPGDEVIMPSFTFSSTATAFARTGAKIRFCDIDEVTLSLDPCRVAEALNPQVRAIVTVHYAGVGGDVEALERISLENSIPLIEDNAHGLFGQKAGRKLGTIGTMSTLSFHETKNIICGEGGALVINEPSLISRAHMLLDKGTNRKAFLDGAVDKYTWHDQGSSFGLSEILAAFLYAQLEKSELIQSRRRTVHMRYRELLEGACQDFEVRLPFERANDVPADHMFYVLLPDELDRGSILRSMAEDRVQATFHYVPLHSAPASASLGCGSHDCPVTTSISSRLLRLPFHNDMTEGEQERVAESFIRSLRLVSSS